MRTWTMMAMATVALTAAGCSKKAPDATPQQQSKPEGHFKITPPPMPNDPAEKHKYQLDMVDHMIADPSMPLDMIQGEAYRRGVTLTPEQIARKKAQTPPKMPKAK